MHSFRQVRISLKLENIKTELFILELIPYDQKSFLDRLCSSKRGA